MRNIIGISAALLLAAAGTASAAPFALTSTAFKSGGNIEQKNAGNIMGCTGENKSPALEWKNPPAGTKSFALMVHDPDAPTGGAGFWHWIVYNIPADATSLPEGAGDPGGAGLPKGAVQGNTDMGKPGYVGICPPPGPQAPLQLHAVPAEGRQARRPARRDRRVRRLQRQRERDRQARQADRRLRPPERAGRAQGATAPAKDAGRPARAAPATPAPAANPAKVGDGLRARCGGWTDDDAAATAAAAPGDCDRRPSPNTSRCSPPSTTSNPAVGARRSDAEP